MTASTVSLNRGAAALVTIALVATGAGGMYLFTRYQLSVGTSGPRDGISGDGRSAAALPDDALTSATPLPDVVVRLSPEAVKRAGITVVRVAGAPVATELRLPGVVAANAYQQVAVTPLVGGRVTNVAAELGEHVHRGQILAQIYSPELADAYTRYVSAQAELDAHEKELDRVGKLAAIGAASQQELERIHAEHTSRQADVHSARSRLELLGVAATTLETVRSEPAVRATTDVRAPIAGVVTERSANVGLNVDAASELFTIVDLSSVWILASVYERDFSVVRPGIGTTIRILAYPDRVIRARVSYVDPQVSPETRTGQIRLEVPNAGGELRLGMYAEVIVNQTVDSDDVTIPRSAIQHLADRTVVYMAHPTQVGSFIEREVRLAPSSGEVIPVLSGLRAGDLVVTTGSFFVRAERERLGLRRTQPLAGDGASLTRPAPLAQAQEAKIVVSDKGFEPAMVTVTAGRTVRLTFVRTTNETCATEVVFSSLKIRRPLPLNQPVVVELTPTKPGELTFACGMDMFRGTVVVQ